MSRWIDVTPSKWFYNEMVEAGNIYMADGAPFIESIPYNVFEPEAPYIYEEIKATKNQKIFTLSKAVTPSANNPLFVYIDGVQTVYEDVEGTKVTMFQAVREGAIVAFASYGIAKVNEYKRPVGLEAHAYPTYTLKKATNYTYNKNNSQYAEYVYAFGKQLRRVSIPEAEATADLQKALKKYIRYSTDSYYITPEGVIHVSYNLNNVTCKITYTTNEGFLKKNTEDFKPTSVGVIFLNRGFPQASATRAEGFVLINRLRQTFYNRFTDIDAVSYNLDTEVKAYNGQRIMSVQGSYTPVDGGLQVWVNDVLQTAGTDYEETNIYTVTFKNHLNDGDIVKFKAQKTKSSHLGDVGIVTYYTRSDTGATYNVNGTVGNADPENDSWWAPHILSLEQEILSSGELMVMGKPVKANGNSITVDGQMQAPTGDDHWFMPNSFMTRAEAVTIINRFRKLCLEKFL